MFAEVKIIGIEWDHGSQAGNGVVSLGRCWGKKVIDLIGWLSVYLQYMNPPIFRRKRRNPSLLTIVLQRLLSSVTTSILIS